MPLNVKVINDMKSIGCERRVRYSEQNEGENPLVFDRQSSAAQFRKQSLIKQALFRDQVQSAIRELIRGYEATTGLSVIRVEYQPEGHQVTIDAIPQVR